MTDYGVPYNETVVTTEGRRAQVDSDIVNLEIFVEWSVACYDRRCEDCPGVGAKTKLGTLGWTNGICEHRCHLIRRPDTTGPKT